MLVYGLDIIGAVWMMMVIMMRVLYGEVFPIGFASWVRDPDLIQTQHLMLGIVLVAMVMVVAVMYYKMRHRSFSTTRAVMIMIAAIGLIVVTRIATSWRDGGRVQIIQTSFGDREVLESQEHAFWQNNTAFSDLADLSPQQLTWRDMQPDIVLVFAESFSAEDSDLFPYMTRLSQQYTSLPLFANACTSDGGHVTTLMWRIPTDYDDVTGAYGTAWSWPWWLPRILRSHGYETSFHSTVSLDFLAQGDFLRQIGFQDIIEHRPVSGQTFVFDSPPDEILVQGIQNYLTHTAESPFFVAAQTISTHRPYDTPAWQTEADAFAYTDRQLMEIYAFLRAQNFFANGMLIIVSDHKKFGFPKESSVQEHGYQAYNHIFGTIITDMDIMADLTGRHVTQRDVYDSLVRLVRRWDAVYPPFNDLFETHDAETDRESDAETDGEYSAPSVVRQDVRMSYCPYRLDAIVVEEDFIYPGQPSPYDDLIAQYAPDRVLWWSGSISWSGQRVSYFHDKIVAHRGWIIQGNNYVYDMKQAAMIGTKHLEVDISITADNEIMMSNSALSYANCQTLSGNIRQYTLDEIVQDCNTEPETAINSFTTFLYQVVPLFETVFVEFKVDPTWDETYRRDVKNAIDRLVRQVQTVGHQDRLVFITYDDEMRDYALRYPWMLVGYDTFEADEIYSLAETRYSHFLTHKDSYDTGHLLFAKEMKMPFVVYTLNGSWEIRDALTWPVDMVLVGDTPLARKIADDLLAQELTRDMSVFEEGDVPFEDGSDSEDMLATSNIDEEGEEDN